VKGTLQAYLGMYLVVLKNKESFDMKLILKTSLSSKAAFLVNLILFEYSYSLEITFSLITANHIEVIVK
jgi:hypothetical protein